MAWETRTASDFHGEGDTSDSSSSDDGESSDDDSSPRKSGSSGGSNDSNDVNEARKSDDFSGGGNTSGSSSSGDRKSSDDGGSSRKSGSTAGSNETSGGAPFDGAGSDTGAARKETTQEDADTGSQASESGNGGLMTGAPIGAGPGPGTSVEETGGGQQPNVEEDVDVRTARDFRGEGAVRPQAGSQQDWEVRTTADYRGLDRTQPVLVPAEEGTGQPEVDEDVLSEPIQLQSETEQGRRSELRRKSASRFSRAFEDYSFGPGDIEVESTDDGLQPRLSDEAQRDVALDQAEQRLDQRTPNMDIERDNLEAVETESGIRVVPDESTRERIQRRQIERQEAVATDRFERNLENLLNRDVTPGSDFTVERDGRTLSPDLSRDTQRAIAEYRLQQRIDRGDVQFEDRDPDAEGEQVTSLPSGFEVGEDVRVTEETGAPVGAGPGPGTQTTGFDVELTETGKRRLLKTEAAVERDINPDRLEFQGEGNDLTATVGPEENPDGTLETGARMLATGGALSIQMVGDKSVNPTMAFSEEPQTQTGETIQSGLDQTARTLTGGQTENLDRAIAMGGQNYSNIIVQPAAQVSGDVADAFQRGAQLTGNARALTLGTAAQPTQNRTTEEVGEATVDIARGQEEDVTSETGAERFAEGAATGGLALANVPKSVTGLTAIGEFGGAAGVATVEGRGGEFAEETKQSAETAIYKGKEFALNNPSQTAGMLAGSLAFSTLAITGASRISTGAGRATAGVIQPGEELLTAGANVGLRRVPYGTRVLSKFPNNRVDNEEIFIRGASRAGRKARRGIGRVRSSVSDLEVNVGGGVGRSGLLMADQPMIRFQRAEGSATETETETDTSTDETVVIGSDEGEAGLVDRQPRRPPEKRSDVTGYERRRRQSQQRRVQEESQGMTDQERWQMSIANRRNLEGQSGPSQRMQQAQEQGVTDPASLVASEESLAVESGVERAQRAQQSSFQQQMDTIGTGRTEAASLPQQATAPELDLAIGQRGTTDLMFQAQERQTVVPQTEVGIVTGSRIESRVQSESAAQVEAEMETEAQQETELALEQELELETETETELEFEMETESELETESEIFDFDKKKEEKGGSSLLFGSERYERQVASASDLLGI